MSEPNRAEVYRLDAYRNRRHRIKPQPTAVAAEKQAAELMSAAAALLCDAGPANLKIAWILQDLCDLLVNAQSKGHADFTADEREAGESPSQLEMLTNLS